MDWNNREKVLALVKEDAEELAFASDRLKNDKEVILAAVEQNGFALFYASKELRNDKEVVLEAIKKNKDALIYASKKLKNDKEFMLEAVKQNGFALKFASDELKNDIEVVLAAVKQNGFALEYAGFKLRYDGEVLQKANESIDRKTDNLLNEMKLIIDKNDESSKKKNSVGVSRKADGKYDMLSEDNQKFYDTIMKKSLTDVFWGKASEEEILKDIYMEKYNQIKEKDPKEYSEDDIKIIAYLTKIAKRKVKVEESIKEDTKSKKKKSTKV